MRADGCNQQGRDLGMNKGSSSRELQVSDGSPLVQRTEYAVEPVGVETVKPSAWTVVK